MAIVLFFVQVFVISLSGVMAPGPMTTATIGRGIHSPYAGLLIAIGHAIVEVPLMLALAFGLGNVFENEALKSIFLIFGGIFLCFMGITMLQTKPIDLDALKGKKNIEKRRSTIVGAMMSLLNPYFFIWWATIGIALITRSLEIGIWAFIVFVCLHWLCDAVWYTILAVLSFKGGRYLGQRFQKWSFGICGLSLILFGGMFIWDVIRG